MCRRPGLQERLQEHELPRMKLGDASIAAAFTARSASVGSCVDIITQGRCTLVTTLQMCKILALNCLVSAFSLSVLHLQGVRMGDTQATCSALGAAPPPRALDPREPRCPPDPASVSAGTALFFLFLSSSRPLSRLSKRRPPASVLSPYVFCSILAQVAAAAAAVLVVW